MSAFSLTLVAIERFYAVVHPHSIRHRITKQKLKVLVPACWILATVTTLPAVYVLFYDDDNKLCSYEYPEHWQGPYFMFFWMIASLIVPAGAILVLYARVIYNLWFENNNNDVGRLAVINARKRITKMMIIVSIFYIICFFTDNFLYIFHSFHPNLLPEQGWHFKIGYCFLALNSSVNPLIYIFQFAEFRKCLKRLFCWKARVSQQPTGTSTKEHEPAVPHPEEHSGATPDTPM